LSQNFRKWKIYGVIVVGVNAKYKCYAESSYFGVVLGLLSKTQDEV